MRPGAGLTVGLEPAGERGGAVEVPEPGGVDVADEDVELGVELVAPGPELAQGVERHRRIQLADRCRQRLEHVFDHNTESLSCKALSTILVARRRAGSSEREQPTNATRHQREVR